MSFSFRLPLLLAITVWLLFRCFLLIKSLANPIRELLGQPPEELQAYALIYVDFLITVSCVMIVVFVFAIMAGRPNENRRFPLIRQGRPLLAFFIYTPIFAFIMILLPGLIYKGVTVNEMDWLDAIVPNAIYLKAAIYASLCFGLSIADIAARPGVTRWWSLPFLILITSFTTRFPLMWWNAVAGWFPSRLWLLWRPVLTAMMCLIPIFSYPLAQPILKKVPIFDAEKYSTIKIPTIGDCYGITFSPDEEEAFIRCTPNLYRLSKKGGAWNLADSLHYTFQWNEASFDFVRDNVHIYAGDQGKLYTSRISDFKAVGVTEIPVEVFPTRKETYHQCFDSVQDRIVIAENEGLLMTIDAQTLIPDKSSFIEDGGEIAKIICAPNRNELLVLQTGALSAYETSTLNLKKKGALPFYSYGIALDQRNNRVFISYPTLMKTAAYLLDSFQLEKVLEAPLGVRPLAVDSDRDLLFMAALGGTIVMSDSKDFRPITRLRISAWPRRLAIAKKEGEMILTGRGVPVAWNYTKAKKGIGTYLRILEFLDKSLNRVIAFDGQAGRSEDFDTLARPYLQSRQKNFKPTGVLVVVPDPVHRRLARRILELKGHKVFIANTREDLLSLLKKNKEEIRILVIHTSFYKYFASEIQKTEEENDIKLGIIRAHEIPFDEYDMSSNFDVILPFSLSELQYKTQAASLNTSP